MRDVEELKVKASEILTNAAEAAEAVAEKAIERKTGARALRSIMEESLLNHMYKIPELENVEKVTVTRECIAENAEPMYTYRSNKQSA